MTSEQKEVIIELYNQEVDITYRKKIEKHFSFVLPAFSTKLPDNIKVGDWVFIERPQDKNKENRYPSLVRYTTESSTIGINHGGYWSDDYGSLSSFTNPYYSYRKATPKEVMKHMRRLITVDDYIVVCNTQMEDTGNVEKVEKIDDDYFYYDGRFCSHARLATQKEIKNYLKSK